MRIEEADFMLWQYGHWCRSGLDQIGCQSPTLAMMREMGVLQMQQATALISDERALLVDGLLADLSKYQPSNVKALLAYYVMGRGYRGVAQEIGYSYADARVAVRAGLAAVAACFTEHRRTSTSTA